MIIHSIHISRSTALKSLEIFNASRCRFGVGGYFHYNGDRISFKKSKFSNALLNVFAIWMKLNAQIRSSSFVEKLIIYSWVAGSMILCLSYDSAFLSFLFIPPLSKIKHLSDFATAVQDGYYHDFGSSRDGIPRYLSDANQENLGIIAKDMLQNHVKFSLLFRDFISGNKSTFLAFF